MKFCIFFTSCLVLMVILARPVIAIQSTLNIHLSAADLEKRGQLKELRYFKDKGVIRLNDMYLIEDDAPACGPPEAYTKKNLFLMTHVHLRDILFLKERR